MNETPSVSSHETPISQARPGPSQPARLPASMAIAQALPYTETGHLLYFVQPPTQQAFAVPPPDQQIGGPRNPITVVSPPSAHSHTDRRRTAHTALTLQQDPPQRYPILENSSKYPYRPSLGPPNDRSGVSLSFPSDRTIDRGNGDLDAYRVHIGMAPTDQQDSQYHQNQSAFSGHSGHQRYSGPSSTTYAPTLRMPDGSVVNPVVSAGASQQDGMTTGWAQTSTDHNPFAARGHGQNSIGDMGRYYQGGPYWATGMTSGGEQQGQAGPSNANSIPVPESRFAQTLHDFPQSNAPLSKADGYSPYPVLPNISPEDTERPTVPTWSSPLESGQHPAGRQPYSSVASSSGILRTSSDPPDVSPYQSVFSAHRMLVDGEDEADQGGGGTRKDKRRAQNRVAQRAFRARSRVQNQEAVDRMDQLEQLVKTQSEQLSHSSFEIQRLKVENAILRSGYTGPLPPGIDDVQTESRQLPDGMDGLPDAQPDRQHDDVDADGDVDGDVDGVDGGDSGILDGWEESIGAWRER